MECNSILAHPKLPLLFVLTKDGRVLCIAVQIKIRPPDNPEVDGPDGNLFTFYISCLFRVSQRARKFKQVQAKKLVKSNKSKCFFVK